MTPLELTIINGSARMRFAVELAIWRHEPAGPPARGYDLCLLRRPVMHIPYPLTLEQTND